MTKLITIPRFAELTGLSYRLCLHLVGTGQIPSVPVGRRRRIDVRWVDRWLAVDIGRAAMNCPNMLISLAQPLVEATETAFPSSPMQVSATRAGRQRQLEASARAAFELRAGRALADAKWAAVRARLVEFVGILRAWDRTTAGSNRGKVEVLCQREP